MRLTKKKAIGIAVELWIWLKETGSNNKSDWPGWDKYGKMTASCPLCEYGERRAGKSQPDPCVHCPYYDVFGGCTDDELEDMPYDLWAGAETTGGRKKYAGQFLEQLKQL